MKRNKYNIGQSVAKKLERTVDGKLFMSKKEANRYKELKALEVEGKIKNLQLQPRFILQCGFVDSAGAKHREISYVADFQYDTVRPRKTIVEDTKGYKTDIYRIKKKLFLYSYQDCTFIES